MKPENYNTTFNYKNHPNSISPNHDMVKNWGFRDEEEQEAHLADAMAVVAEKNGLGANDLQHLFPAVLRMLKSDIRWANNINKD
jgi:hypothetical protein